MMKKWVAELVSKYSFIKKATLERGGWRFHYIDQHRKEKSFWMPMRSTRPMVQRKLEGVKKKIDYYVRRPDVNYGMIIAHTWGE